MNFDLTEEQKMVKDTARKFAEAEIIPFARENDVNEHFPIEIFKKMAAQGFSGIGPPKKPSAAIFLNISIGKCSFTSFSLAKGIISASANFLAVSLTIFCSSVRSKFIKVYLLHFA